MNNQRTLLTKPELSTEKSLKTLVENRTVYSLNNCELNLFETYQESQLVPLKFNDLVVTSMLRGKKVMHLFDEPGFDYLPGETVVIPSNVEMKIDFPEASKNNPTQCLALAIEQSKIKDTLSFLNERYPKEGVDNYWQLNYQNYFFYNNVDLAATINKLIKECMSTSITKDALADLTLQELLIRIIQTQTAKSIDDGLFSNPNNPISEVIEFIRLNLKENINLKSLSDKACMSTTSFYRFFKRELGMSPIEFVLNEKIKYAKKLLKNPSIQINEVCYLSGFEDANYFIRLFKKHEGITPKQYQLLYVN
ncbi:AraC family transcriptional regulator [Flavobacterium aquatile]|uniref:AraC family transcriptional regulator n=1 Tax=Flavobacterium aquatile LMG 4008 = ATCC 11947 TaxID=1453498 RepID=A0A095SW93_9FLAO|nr:AraC family transcriptional regulator [Flavobacterium aquatile]KGD68594.1 AraC family transcriptional regulator [Flavobacterium aquatile LMG 4008 = ATCC 11947]OXA68477.1 AraC family transcriptional regulator [Flavobacterium aquatile LMG 4008 = ATCC 11947]GEC79721.1 transcriptional regulator [Flavobacterium aquatile]